VNYPKTIIKENENVVINKSRCHIQQQLLQTFQGMEAANPVFSAGTHESP